MPDGANHRKDRRFAPSVLIALLTALITATVQIAIMIYEEDRKQLVYEVFGPTCFVDATQANLGNLRMYYDDERVETVSSVSVLVENAGNVIIRASDFDEGRPLSVEFGADARVLSAIVGDRHPRSLRPSVSHDGTSVFVAPLTMLPEHRFSVLVHLSGDVDAPAVAARIDGAEDPQLRRALARWPGLVPVIHVVLGLAWMIVCGYMFPLVVEWRASGRCSGWRGPVAVLGAITAASFIVGVAVLAVGMAALGLTTLHTWLLPLIVPAAWLWMWRVGRRHGRYWLPAP